MRQRRRVLHGAERLLLPLRARLDWQELHYASRSRTYVCCLDTCIIVHFNALEAVCVGRLRLMSIRWQPQKVTCAEREYARTGAACERRARRRAARASRATWARCATCACCSSPALPTRAATTPPAMTLPSTSPAFVATVGRVSARDELDY